MRIRVVSVGEVLWDVFADAEILGGAPLNFCVNTARLGHSAYLVTALGDDDRGKRAFAGITALGVHPEFIQEIAGALTGVALVSTLATGEPHFEIPRPAAFDFVALSADAQQAISALRPDWLYVGTLFHTQEDSENLTTDLIKSLPETRVFYDMNLREGAWNLPLVVRLCKFATILKLNELEAEILGATVGLDSTSFTLEEFCSLWAKEHQIETICVTLGPNGCFVYQRGRSIRVPGFPTVVQDTVGAGDAFAAAFLHGQHHGWEPAETARFANAVGSVVASRSGATPAWDIEECVAIASTHSLDVRGQR